MPVRSHPLDALGNWAEFKQDAGDGAAWDLNQARDHNAVNEIDTDTNHANGPDPDAITESAGPAWVSPACDAAGHMTSGPKPADETARIHMTYDAWNRLVAVRADDAQNPGQPGDLIATCRYDALGRRIQKVVAGDPDITYDYYHCGYQVVEVRKDSDVYEQVVWDGRYVHSPCLRWRDADENGSLEETLYYTGDANFNVTSLVEPDGDVVERVIYDPYGRPTFYDGAWANPSASSAYANEILFTGHRRDAETGLYYAGARYYHPTLGRWICRDPVRYADGLNVYVAMRSNPVLFVDAFGLAAHTGNVKQYMKWLEGRGGNNRQMAAALKQALEDLKSSNATCVKVSEDQAAEGRQTVKVAEKLSAEGRPVYEYRDRVQQMPWGPETISSLVDTGKKQHVVDSDPCHIVLYIGHSLGNLFGENGFSVPTSEQVAIEPGVEYETRPIEPRPTVGAASCFAGATISAAQSAGYETLPTSITADEFVAGDDRTNAEYAKQGLTMNPQNLIEHATTLFKTARIRADKLCKPAGCCDEVRVDIIWGHHKWGN